MNDNEIVLPPCRLVQGSLYVPQTTDALNKPLKTKDGNPRVNYFFAVAVPKGAERHWNETSWGRIIVAVAREAFPDGKSELPSFAWKVGDGDSTVPNSEGYKPCDNDGFPGNWIVRFSGGFAPQIVDAANLQPILETDFIKLGDWIEVAGNVAGNGAKSNPNPGVFLNHAAVAFRAYGQRITPKTTVDVSKLGFGKSSLPPGVGTSPPPSGFSQPPAATVSTPPPMAAPAPHTAILNPPVPPVAQGRVMFPKAQGIAYGDYIKSGWTDELLIQEGYMQP